MSVAADPKLAVFSVVAVRFVREVADVEARAPMNVVFYCIRQNLGSFVWAVLKISNSPSSQIPARKNKKFSVWLGLLKWNCSRKPNLQHRNDNLPIRVNLCAVLVRLFVVAGFYKALKRSLYGPPPFHGGAANKKLRSLKPGNDRHQGYQLRCVLRGGIESRRVSYGFFSGGELKEAARRALRHQKRSAGPVALVVKENNRSKPVFAVDYFQWRCGDC